MQELEPASRHDADPIHSDSSLSDMDGPQMGSRDEVEDFARKLDQLVINQQHDEDDDEDEDEDEDFDNDAFGYQQLPQDTDGPETDSGHNENGSTFTHETDQPSRTEPVQYQAGEDNNIPEDQVEFIKNVMSKIQLPAPDWAKRLPEERWLPRRQQ
ncbi:hypothetical protein INT43_001646 [Umbelopsis isabellina]|uniref:Male-enhanced antigen 1 n=1 Tax=Mortierella isabellina TaxID=91625 RepID=A0A8H7PS71_MORIS|nr:hypothetical protein INT43_001646 [Umbelopsis isabellina]